MKASLLMILVVILAHLSSQKQLPLAHEDPGSSMASAVLVEIGTDRTDTQAKSQVAAYCSIAPRGQTLNQGCQATALSCEDYLLKEYRSGAVASIFIDNLEPRAAHSRPTRTNCIGSVAINSSTIELKSTASVCN